MTRCYTWQCILKADSWSCLLLTLSVNLSLSLQQLHYLICIWQGCGKSLFHQIKSQSKSLTNIENQIKSKVFVTEWCRIKSIQVTTEVEIKSSLKLDDLKSLSNPLSNQYTKLLHATSASWNKAYQHKTSLWKLGIWSIWIIYHNG